MFETLQILFSDSVTHPFQNPLVFRIDGRKKKKIPMSSISYLTILYTFWLLLKLGCLISSSALVSEGYYFSAHWSFFSL